jgi:hypothetical protein
MDSESQDERLNVLRGSEIAKKLSRNLTGRASFNDIFDGQLK